MAIWVLKAGHREGPYEERDVRELLYEGTYSDIDPAIRDGQLDWSTLGQVLGRTRAGAESTPSEPAAPPPLPEPEASPEFPAVEAPDSNTPSPLPSAFTATERPIPVAVVDFQMPFGSMVLFMVKWVIAAIPALLILGVVASVFWGFFAMLIAALLRYL